MASMPWKKILTISVYALFLLVLFTKFDYRKIGGVLLQIRPWTIVQILLLNGAVLVIRSVRYRVILRDHSRGLTVAKVFPIISFGLFASLSTPVGTGDVLRLPFLKRHGIAMDVALGTIVFERLVDVLVLLLMSFLGVLLLKQEQGLSLAIFLASVGVCVLVIYAANAQMLRVFAAVDAVYNWLARRKALRCLGLHRLESKKEGAYNMFRTMRLLGKRLSLVFTSVCLTYLLFLVVALRMYLILRDIGVEVGLLDAWVCYSVPYLIGLFSTLPLGLVAMDASMIAIVRKAGGILDQGAAATLGLRGLITLPMLLAGFLCFLYLNRKGAVTAAPSAETPPTP